MKRLALRLTLLVAALSVSSAHAADPRPNLIFILLDDLGKEWISAYGAEGIETPDIDALIDFSDLLPTFADFAGADPEPGFTYDGYSASAVFLGEESDTPREWILAMGSHPGVATNEGIENAYWFRDRVIRDKRFKVFVSPQRTVEKLVDLEDDPEEQTNRVDDPGYPAILERLSAAAASLPPRDADPRYQPIPGYPSYETSSNPTVAEPRESVVHKIGYPGKPASHQE